MEVHLVADTNLFFECKQLEELQWSELGFDPIAILLTKPVLDEIDKHKKATGRTRKRALEIFRRIREMLTTSKTELVIREASPRVVLRRIPNVAPDEALSGSLDYNKNDDRLIGILSTLQKTAACKVMLFTDDTGPAVTADSLSLPFQMINEDWRRPTEQTTEDKIIRELEKDLATYRSQEPNISISHNTPTDVTGHVTVTRKIAQQLAEPEIAALIDALRLKHPMKTAFSPPTMGKSSTDVASAVSRFEPPTEEEIRKYQEVLYPQWCDSCRKILSELHMGRDEIEPPLILHWAMTNDGTRPASQVRVQFEAQGPIMIKRLPRSGEKEDEDISDDEITHSSAKPAPILPRPPKAPEFRTIIAQATTPLRITPRQPRDLAGLGLRHYDLDGLTAASRALGMGGLDSLSSAMRGLDSLAGISHLTEQHRRLLGMGSMYDPPAERVFVPPHLPVVIPSHDPEAFYYDHWSARIPVKTGALTCDLWRHQHGEEQFHFEVLFLEEGESRGSVLCTVHAKNLTKPATSRITCCRKVEPITLLQMAQSMVERCE